MLIVEATKGKMKAGWSLKGILEDIFPLLNALHEFYIQHVFREGNVTADSLAAAGLDTEGLQCWRKEVSFPPLAVVC